ncbi:biogenesis of lysosome-related organelles complex 1 subunit 5 isoform X1 [Brienomyrus brachyistius]|uniref:biogenesis of lysosome-related organelles complex 1 subunit 5 isoform X1 n=1 Tax=Brienomyrus brachyistius TaxID=42636 RepID=UPI0020B42E1C|nr:biogenesis of lysosome-related organelles complex 1 subunit 5 isoform X1 [Brienomyrus brachyistius]
MDRIIKDVGDIQSRLTDHRPVIQGEIRYFVREFEEKRGFRDGRLLENLCRTVLEATDQTMPECSEALQLHLPDVLTRLEMANHMAQRVQQRELEAQEVSKSITDHPVVCFLFDQLQSFTPALQSPRLQLCMDRHRQEWEEFMKEQTLLKEQVDEEHAKAVGRLSAQYSEMKKELTKMAQL